MKILSAILAAGVTASVCAQSQTLVVDPAGVGLTYTNPGANFFDIDVTNPAGITLQELTVRLNSAGGTVGELQVWITPTTHIGNENNQAVWTQLSTGTIIDNAATNSACQSALSLPTPDTFLAMGTYGVAMVYVDVNHVFDALVTYPSGPYADANISIDNGTTQATAWVSAPLTTFTFGGINYFGTLENFSFTYSVGNIPHACAICTTEGLGSNLHTASAVQLFGEPNPNGDANAALEGNVLSFVPNGAGTGYIMLGGAGSGATYVDPATAPWAGMETNLPLVANQEVQVTTLLPFITQTDDGVPVLTNDFYINSNGYVSLELPQTGLGNAPRNPQGAMQADSTAFFFHHDFDNSEAGSGNISYYEDLTNSIFYVTWAGVEGVPDTVVNPSTIQFQFNMATGQVDIVMSLVDAIGGSTVSGGDNYLIGWSPAGPSPFTEEFDYTALPATGVNLTLPEVLPLTLTTVGAPLIGQTFDLTTINPPANPAGIGVNLLAASEIAPIDINIFGAPLGTLLYIDPNVAVLNTVTAGAPTLSLPVTNLASLAGVQLYSQTFWLDLLAPNFPFENTVGSNFITCTIGNF